MRFLRILLVLTVIIGIALKHMLQTGTLFGFFGLETGGHDPGTKTIEPNGRGLAQVEGFKGTCREPLASAIFHH
jgi:hypothetical protein